MKSAFTLLELIFVLIILSLIFAISYFHFQPDYLRFGAEQILNDLKYTRHLALMQNSFRAKDLDIFKAPFFKRRWQLYFIRSKDFTNKSLTYGVFLDKNGDGNANIGRKNSNKSKEIAQDLLNPNKLMISGQSGVLDQNDPRSNSTYDLQKKYAIIKLEFFGSCQNSTRVTIDEYSRLYSPLRNSKNLYDKSLFFKNDCIIRLSSKNDFLCIIINPSTAYAYISKDKFSCKALL